MKDIKSKRIPVQVDAATFESVKAYLDITGVSIARTVERALSEWIETVGVVYMEVLQAKGNGKNLLMAKARKTRARVAGNETADCIPADTAALEMQPSESGTRNYSPPLVNPTKVRSSARTNHKKL